MAEAYRTHCLNPLSILSACKRMSSRSCVEYLVSNKVRHVEKSCVSALQGALRRLHWTAVVKVCSLGVKRWTQVPLVGFLPTVQSGVWRGCGGACLCRMKQFSSKRKGGGGCGLPQPWCQIRHYGSGRAAARGSMLTCICRIQECSKGYFL
jgi:hypothetical protein